MDQILVLTTILKRLDSNQSLSSLMVHTQMLKLKEALNIDEAQACSLLKRGFWNLELIYKIYENSSAYQLISSVSPAMNFLKD